MTRAKITLLSLLMLGAGCAKVQFVGQTRPVKTHAEITQSVAPVDPRHELIRLHKEFTNIGEGLYRTYGLHVLEAPRGFWTRDPDWAHFEEADRALIRLLLGRVLAIASRRTAITRDQMGWDDKGPPDRAAKLRETLDAFEANGAQGQTIPF